jgi:hypothetical protein
MTQKFILALVRKKLFYVYVGIWFDGFPFRRYYIYLFNYVACIWYGLFSYWVSETYLMKQCQ